MRKSLALLAAVLLTFGSVSLCRAEEPKPDQPKTPPADKKDEKKDEKKAKRAVVERLWPRGPEVEKLKAAGMTDEQIAKAKDAVAAVLKKNDELEANKDVAAAEAEVKKAEATLKAAEEKSKALKDNFDLNDELKKAVVNSAPEDKKQAVSETIKYNPKKETKAENKVEKKVEKKAEETKP